MERNAKRSVWACLIMAASASFMGCDVPASLPDDGFVDVPGGRVAFRVIGNGGKVPVLVIHGGPGASSCLYPSTFTGIAAERPVVMYDQLGSGYSDRITDLERHAVLPRFVAEVAAIREELGLDQLHLVGHSWGATVAMEYLLTGDPEGVLSVVFVGPLLGTARWIQDANDLVATLPDETQAAIRTATETGDYSTPEFQAANTAFLAEFGIRTPRDELNFPDCAKRPPGNSGLYNYMWGPSEFLADGTLRDYDRIPRLPELGLPTLFLVGEYDEARPETMREFQSLVPGSVVEVIPDAGHVSMVDQPELFNAAINDFLTEVEGR